MINNDNLPIGEKQDLDALVHPIEVEFKTSWSDLLDAMDGGFRLKVAVRGRLAEHMFKKHLIGLCAAGVIDEFSMPDKDDLPDAAVIVGDKTYQVEVKNVHPDLRTRNRAIVVEVQKTRGSKDHPETRQYLISHFDVVVACLFNVTGEWTFLFAASKDLAPHKTHPDRLAPIQLIPLPLDPDGIWRKSLAEVLR